MFIMIDYIIWDENHRFEMSPKDEFTRGMCGKVVRMSNPFLSARVEWIERLGYSAKTAVCLKADLPL